jgi:TrmH RNA methyltransferase
METVMSKKDNVEMRIYGENACAAVFKKRPEDIIQLFLTKEQLNKHSNITKFCAQHKKAYHLVLRDELDKMTKATHHEDICMLVKKKPARTLAQFLNTKKNSSILLALENIGNPHNIGAIIRSAAHFGVDGIILTEGTSSDTPSAIRTSEGGAEYVEVFEEKNFHKTLALLSKNKFQIVTTSSHAKTSLYDVKWEKNIVIVFGEEAHGITKEIQGLGTVIKIPGTDFVESLNVSVATAVILSDYYQKAKIK